MADVLLVDDNEIIMQGIQKAFERAGHQVVTAKNGDEATKLLTSLEFHMVVTDLHLPILDGLELIAFIKAHEINTKIIVVSSRSDERSRMECYKMGIENFFQKPISPSELVARTAYLLREEIEDDDIETSD